MARKIVALSVVAAGLVFIQAAHGQSYPLHDVHFICAAVPGSSPDIITRFYADRMRGLLKRRIIVENRPGALGNIATEYVAKSEPDGYTVYITSGSAMVSSLHLMKKPPIDSIDALPLVATLNNSSGTIIVRANSPWKSLAELTEELRRKGDKASYGIANPVSKVLGALYMQAAGLSAVEVQYKSAAEFPNDLASGALDFAISDAALSVVAERNGTARILASGGGKRVDALPGVPTMAEVLGKDIDLSGLWGAFVPAGTPNEVMDKLNFWFNEVTRSEEAKRFFRGIGADPWAIGRDEAQIYLRQQVKAWAEFVRIAKIEPQ